MSPGCITNTIFGGVVGAHFAWTAFTLEALPSVCACGREAIQFRLDCFKPLLLVPTGTLHHCTSMSSRLRDAGVRRSG